MAPIRLIGLPAFKEFMEWLSRTPLRIGLLNNKLRSWFGVPRVARSTGNKHRRPATETRKTARLLVELLEDRSVPSTFMVNELLDTHAVNLISGTDSTGNISLRSAIEAADELGGDQTIQFDPAVFGAPQIIILTKGLLDLKDTTGAMTIQGPTVGVTVSGNHASEVFRVESGTTADLTGLTIRDGKITGDGGGIANSGTLTLRDSTISGNTALIYASEHGEGIYCYFGSGGGIFNKGSLTIDTCTISGNTAPWNGAGVFNSIGATINLTNSIVSGNAKSASPYIYWSYGGGIDNQGEASLANSTVSGNSATANGGGIYNTGTATLLDCTVSGNSTGWAGGGVCGYDGATTTLERCTISNNSAGEGGGIASPTPNWDIDPVTLIDSTVSGNTATEEGGGVYLGFNNEATLDDSSISGNTALMGGGIYNQSCLTLNNTLVAGNTSKSADGDLVGAVQSSSANNLIGDGRGITGGISNHSHGNQVGTRAAPINPLLAPLGNYGGPTETMALLPGSPAIDAGSIAATPGGVTTDQRGQPRIVNGTVDIGAFESSLASLPAPNDLTPSGAIAASAGYDTPLFSWNAVVAADHYDLIVVDNKTGLTAITVQSIRGTAYATTTAQALTPGHSFTTYILAFSADDLTCGFATQNFSLAALPAPTSITPGGEITASLGYDLPTFTWADSGADHYSLKVVDNTTHTTPIAVSTIRGTSYATTAAQALTPGHSYTVYVDAFSTNGEVNVLATQAFTLAPLAAPTGITPNGVVTASAAYDQPTFNWNAIAGADHYTLVVVDNTTGATPIIVRNLSAASYSSTQAQALTPGHRFTVKIYAYSANGKSYSLGTQLFALTPLAAPTGITPSGVVMSTAGYDQPTFNWNAVAGADHYTLIVVDNTIGAAPIVVRNLSGTSYSSTASQALTPGHKCTVKVYAYSTNNKSYSLGTQSFTLAALTAPTLGAPSGTAATSPSSLTWAQVPGADHYYLYVVDDTTGVAVIKNSNIAVNSFSPSVALIAGHKYTWRVAAVSTNKGVAIWSTSENFTIT